ncbi:A disintegrin and metalloproteinase with thrombospondin motifs 18-like isoform X1 [Mya arenaria]|uniref:A disintegrin and metalloproteinase with thrombospondin motifs 18-like isoform X1 n=1 Tax=Mya arenaria TaxID=6604 RepID=UPI0022E1B80C|nr:A disintegrin and metalloproteinase with thrombospondin motifs 18-like isoform X1 [Mya arenaria]
MCLLDLSKLQTVFGSSDCDFSAQEDLPSRRETAYITLIYGDNDVIPRRAPSEIHIDLNDQKLIYELEARKLPINAETRVTYGDSSKLNRQQTSKISNDCVVTGTSTNDFRDNLVLSFCSDITGLFHHGTNTFHVEEAFPTESKDTFNVSISKSTRTKPLGGSTGPYFGSEVLLSRKKRAAIPQITVETVVILDEDFVASARSRGQTTNQSLIDFMTMRWTAVQAEWGRADLFGYDIHIEVKELVIWETNPSWYNPSTNLLNTLSSICTGAYNQGLYTDFDHIHLFTGTKGTDVAGKAFTGKVCDPRYKCAVSTDTRVTEFTIAAHELGHNMGMNHDVDNGCPAPNDGIMGSKVFGWSACSISETRALLNQSSSSCLNETNVNSATALNLVEAWPGMIFTDDEICEFKFGKGYRYRKFPYGSFSECTLYSCVNMNTSSPLYGVMYNEAVPTDGRYCGPQQVCSSQVVNGAYQCIFWNETGLDLGLITEVAGNWSSYEDMTSCSRTCGTGVQYRQRKCNNPTPRNTMWCDGNEYHAELCNTHPCSDDPSDDVELRKARAGESCSHMRAAEIYEEINLVSTNFLDTGDRFNNYEWGQCEVKCGTAEGVTVGGFQRFGLMPDGTQCDLPEMTSFIETNNLPGGSGRTGRCVQGYCQMFGCDNSTNDVVFDRCGVCNGDNSTCQFIEGVYTVNVTKDERWEIMTLPAGAFNIGFYFIFNDMRNHYFELRTLDGTGIITGSSDFRDNPKNYAGAYWYSFFPAAYLYAEGPTDTPVVIKLHNRGSNPNAGVQFAYSLPDDMSSCTGTCENGGTWNDTLCYCECASGFYGKSCNATCNKYCNNGQNLATDACQCDCQGNTYGSVCNCRYPFTGRDCQDCKVTSCQNGGTFNATGCRCTCPVGFGGLDCSGMCADTSASCATDAAAGKCESNNENMEKNCYPSCGLCEASPTTTASATTSASTTAAATQDSTTSDNGLGSTVDSGHGGGVGTNVVDKDLYATLLVCYSALIFSFNW